jgi:hypothetical protein
MAGYFFHALYLPARLMHFFGKKRETKIKPPGENGAWLHRMLAFLLKIDYLCLPRRLQGTSAIACLKPVRQK